MGARKGPHSREWGKMKFSKSDETLLAIGVFLTPVVFWTGVTESFDVVKFQIVVVLGSLSMMSLGRVIRPDARASSPIATSFSWIAMVSGILATIFAINPGRSFFGGPQRYTGLVTLLCLVAIFISAQRVGQSSLILRSITLGSVVNSVYIILQRFDLDPLTWSIVSSGLPITGTTGNPNSAGLISAFAIPFLVYGAQRASGLHQLASIVALNVCLLGVVFTESFQAEVGVLAALIVLIFPIEGEKSSGVTAREIPLAVMLLLPLFVAEDSLAILVLIGLTVLYEIVRLTDTKMLKVVFGPRPLLIAAIVLVCGVTALPIGRSSISRGVSTGLVERGDFWRASWEIIRSNPWLGIGFDNYLLSFPLTRPKSHAESFFSSLSSSPHSLLLAPFVSAGLVFGFVAIFMMVSTLKRVAFSLLKGTDQARLLCSIILVGLPYVFVGAESLAPILILTVLVGMLFSVHSSYLVPSQAASRKKIRKKGVAPITPRNVILSVGALAILVVGSFPLVAGIYERASFQRLSRGDLVGSIEQLEFATDLVSHDGVLRAKLAELYFYEGEYAQSKAAIREALRLTNWSPVLAVPILRIGAEMGDFELVLEGLEKAADLEPNDPNFRAQAFQLLEDIRIFLDQNPEQISITLQAELTRIARRLTP